MVNGGSIGNIILFILACVLVVGMLTGIGTVIYCIIATAGNPRAKHNRVFN